jgi:7,8-dihydropterin-6-yl-methyl-4-(beta-D-ribofuranosyl)aminobenzene 5'-phosphate synthase
LPFVLERAPRAIVHLHPQATGARFSIHEGTVRSIGMPAAALAALAAWPAARVRHVLAPCELAPGIGLTGPVPRLSAFEDTGGPFFLDPDGLESDPITDDLSLWIDTPDGLVVCLGCAHAGVVNILTHIRQVTGRDQVDTIVGGMHLAAANEARLQATVAALRALAPRRIVPCHCTGDAATAYLAAELGELVIPGRVGQLV